MKKRLVAGIVAILMAVPLLFVSAGPAAAACTSEVRTKYDYALINDDETGGYARFFVSIYYYDCVGYRTFRYVRMGYAPDTTKNSSLGCGGLVGQIDKIRMNLGPILGHNPDEWTFDCLGGGDSKVYDWVNTSVTDGSSADTCVGASWTAVIVWWNDRSGSVPLGCF